MENHDNTIEREEEEEEDGPPPGWSSVPPSEPPATTPPTAPAPPSDAEMAQMVCGSCRQLLSYTKGARRVQCSSCQMVNFVLEAHEVGHVKCGSCSVLLMYPCGAPSVRCSSCRSVTEIRDHKQRPPWSEQQGHPPQIPKRSTD